jgi:hypothetical protein
LARYPGVSVESLLTGKRSKTRGLGDVAVVAVDKVKLDVEPAQPDEANDIIEADRGAAGFPPRNGGLGGAGAVGELGLGEADPTSRLPDQVSAVRAHRPSITVLLYTR